MNEFDNLSTFIVLNIKPLYLHIRQLTSLVLMTNIY